MKFNILILAVLFLFSCGKSETTTETVSTFDRTRTTNYKSPFHSTTGTEEDGESNVQAYQKNIVTTYFSKEIDMGHLNSIAKSNVKMTLDYIKTNLGVELYRMDCDSYYCSKSVLSGLESPPALIQNYWDKLFKEDELEGYTILGLYLAKGSDLEGEKLDTPTILFNYEAQRKTVVHEFMHHLFTQHDSGNKSIYDLFDRSRIKLMEVVDKLENKLSYEVMVDLMDKLEDFSDKSSKYVVAYPLEEATIERLIIERMDARKFTNLPGKSKYDSMEYGSTNLNNAKDLLRKIEILNDSLRSRVIPGLDISEAQKQELTQVSDRIATRMQNLINKIYRFNMWFLTQGYSPSMAKKISAELGGETIHCGHTHKPIKVNFPALKF